MIKTNSKIIISEWSGRLGNNLIQLSNALFICWKLKGELEYPDHRFLKRKPFKFNTQESEFTYITRFYDPIDCSGVFPSIAERRFILQKFVRDLLTFDLDSEDYVESEWENRLVIQMRSGELFLKNPNPKYVPSPLAYFTKIINTYDYKDILIVCEDLTNPVIEKLAEIYHPYCKIQTSDLVSDIRTIANARNLCTTVGTFGFVLTLLSNKIEQLYVDDIPKALLDFGYFKTEDLELNFQINKYEIKNYIKCGEWRNRKEQYNLVFKLPEKEIIEISGAKINQLANYYKKNWKEFFAEAGHIKLLIGLKKYIPIQSTEIKKKVVGIDVGCCVGEYLPNFDPLIKDENVEIIAFEPNPGNLAILESRLSKMDKVTLFKCCLSNVNEGEVPFYIGKGVTHTNARNGLSGLRNGGRILCKTDIYRLDTLLEEYYKEEISIGFIKIDTEGNDTNIIKGMGKYLKNTKYLLFESSDCLDDERGPGIKNPLKDIVDYLEKYGFNTYKIGAKKLIPLYGNYWNEIYEQKKFWSNSFALKKDNPIIKQLVDENFNYRY